MSLDSAIEIRRATAAEIRSLRHRVLREGLPIEAADFHGDDDPSTFHAAAVTDKNIVVGCATIMLEPYLDQPAWRLRGMAVDPDYQRRQLGARLLDLCEQHARTHGPLTLWCNARTPAGDFYRRLGWERHGTEFAIETAGPHYRMTKTLSKR